LTDVWYLCALQYSPASVAWLRTQNKPRTVHTSPRKASKNTKNLKIDCFARAEQSILLALLLAIRRCAPYFFDTLMMVDHHTFDVHMLPLASPF